MADSIGILVEEMGKKARLAGRRINAASPEAKKKALVHLALLLERRQTDILEANGRDTAAAAAAGLDAARLNRLTLTPAILAEMAEACRRIAAVPECVGALDSQWQQPNGLLVGRMRVPLGVIAMIFESRPNVTVDAAILCLKAGNAIILRGGSEALHSNMALIALVRQALDHAGLPADAAQLVPVTDREAVSALCKLDAYIDVMIPRGGESLIRSVAAQATMPVLKHDKGVCHAYVDAGADTAAAVPVICNSKAQRPATCNSLECLLIHTDELAALAPALAPALHAAGVSVRACPASLEAFSAGGVAVTPARPEDFGAEFGDYILAVKVVACMDEALDHIALYGSRHTEVIFTRDYARAARFTREADASMVGVNASTRFNDGGQLGLGAEIGISTSKLHAYGPMGIRELTTTKFVVMGNGQTRA